MLKPGDLVELAKVLPAVMVHLQDQPPAMQRALLLTYNAAVNFSHFHQFITELTFPASSASSEIRAEAGEALQACRPLGGCDVDDRSKIPAADNGVREQLLPLAVLPEASPEALAMSIYEFRFSVRARKCAARYGVNTLGGLAQLTVGQILKSPNVGKSTLNEIRDVLAQYGLKLRGENGT